MILKPGMKINVYDNKYKYPAFEGKAELIKFIKCEPFNYYNEKWHIKFLDKEYRDGFIDGNQIQERWIHPDDIVKGE